MGSELPVFIVVWLRGAGEVFTLPRCDHAVAVVLRNIWARGDVWRWL